MLNHRHISGRRRKWHGEHPTDPADVVALDRRASDPTSAVGEHDELWHLLATLPRACARSSCCATSRTSPTTRSPGRSASPSRACVRARAARSPSCARRGVAMTWSDDELDALLRSTLARRAEEVDFEPGRWVEACRRPGRRGPRSGAPAPCSPGPASPGGRRRRHRHRGPRRRGHLARPRASDPGDPGPDLDA
nr:hypothetical protein [Janibacter melonis]